MSRSSSRSRSSSKRPTSARTLHPQRVVELFRRSGALSKLFALVCAVAVLAGGWLVAAPFDTRVETPDPPPFTLELACPPSLVGAFVGTAGITSPDDAVAADHAEGCTIEGRQRLLTGGLLIIAAVLNAAAALEWSRVLRRTRRRRRRDRRRQQRMERREASVSGAEPAADVAGEHRTDEAEHP